MTKVSRKYNRISVTLSPQYRQLLEEVASTRDRSVSWMAAYAIGQFLSGAIKDTKAAVPAEGHKE